MSSGLAPGPASGLGGGGGLPSMPLQGAASATLAKVDASMKNLNYFLQWAQTEDAGRYPETWKELQPEAVTSQELWAEYCWCASAQTFQIPARRHPPPPTPFPPLFKITPPPRTGTRSP